MRATWLYIGASEAPTAAAAQEWNMNLKLPYSRQTDTQHTETSGPSTAYFVVDGCRGDTVTATLDGWRRNSFVR